MSKPLPSPFPELIPESAPFTPEQRTWLNGFVAGLVSFDGGAITALSPDQSAALMPIEPATKAPDDDDGAPWHDQTLPLPERMKLAEGRPLQRRMMAAMAQQDCGQCGYNCHDYSSAVFSRKEERLKSACLAARKPPACSRRFIRRSTVLRWRRQRPRPQRLPLLRLHRPWSPGIARDRPAEAVFLSRTRLNKPGSAKETWHVVLDLADSGMDYTVGDAFGLFPTNDPALADAVLHALDAPADFPIGGRTLREVLIDGVSLAPAPDMLFQLISYITGGERRQKAKALAAGEDPDGDAANLDVLAVIEKFRGIRPDPEAFIESSIRCSRGFIRSRLRQRPIPIASRFVSTRCATRSMAARVSVSLLPSWPNGPTPAKNSKPTCRRRTPSDCPPTRRCPSL